MRATLSDSSLRIRIALPVAALALCWPLWNGHAAAEAAAGSQEITFRILLSKGKCQFAVWLTDDDGDFVDTVYVTRSVAQKGLGNRKGDLDGKLGGARTSSLPVWAHARGVDYGNGNFYPPKDNSLPDAITSATPKAGEFVWTWKPQKRLEPGRYRFFVEVNKSFDKNEQHKYSWYRGQPSVVWQGVLRVGDEVLDGAAAIVGHGHVAGADGKINPDVSTLTTALGLIESVGAVYRP
jgi:hypothetical protein